MFHESCFCWKVEFSICHVLIVNYFLSASTKEVILGTENGQIYETAVDEVEKREKYVKQLFELTELREAITGLQMETASVGNATRYYVMAVTPTRLYSFTGIGSWK
uniref:Pep3/Vps18 beta-propeller domain-containing protein n=1 Tax=Ananas comosus var. bracteatus TaxID=296719 RepID=A0A6V7NWH1_ANACO|nr:unnamed protein product [Ananas comosus var. bracteatus]